MFHKERPKISSVKNSKSRTTASSLREPFPLIQRTLSIGIIFISFEKPVSILSFVVPTIPDGPEGWTPKHPCGGIGSCLGPSPRSLHLLREEPQCEKSDFQAEVGQGETLPEGEPCLLSPSIAISKIPETLGLDSGRLGNKL